MRATVLLRLAVLAGLVALLGWLGGDALLLFAPLLLVAAPLALDRYPGVDVLARLARREPRRRIRGRAPLARPWAPVLADARSLLRAGPASRRGPPVLLASAA